jgi:CRP-like cAMP-binding protein
MVVLCNGVVTTREFYWSEGGNDMPNSNKPRAITNRILSAIPPAEYEQLLPDLQLIPLKIRASLHEPGDPMPYVYFPNTGVISMLTVLENGDAIEIATVGNEGMTDISVFLGFEDSDSRLLAQVPGSALRMDSVRFREHVDRNTVLRRNLGYYAVSMFTLVAQSAACNRRHPLVERCARWVLMTHDRVDNHEFRITHEFLSEMLGVRRPSVSIALETLQRAGVIAYRRGRLMVLNRAGLEAASCECYGIIRARFDRLPGSSPEAARGRRRLASGEHASLKQRRT